MSYTNQSTQQRFPFPYDTVYRGLLRVISNLGMDIEDHDKTIGRIKVYTSISMLSWGENLTIIAEKIDDSSTLVKIESSLAVSINVAGAYKHQQNFEQIISSLSKLLRRKSELIQDYCMQENK